MRKTNDRLLQGDWHSDKKQRQRNPEKATPNGGAGAPAPRR